MQSGATCFGCGDFILAEVALTPTFLGRTQHGRKASRGGLGRTTRHPSQAAGGGCGREAFEICNDHPLLEADGRFSWFVRLSGR